MEEPPLDVLSLVYAPSGQDRLRLMYEPRDSGSNFRRLEWQRQQGQEWTNRLVISREQFQGGYERRRWVSDLYSLDPQRGWAALQIAEGDTLIGAFATSFCYSWRTWDLVNNCEIGKLKDCENPFDRL